MKNIKERKEDITYQCLECMEDQNTNGKKFTEKDKTCPHCGSKIGKFVCILKARV
jgi:DNA-directed RNA polymerase subunit RPC12/RpoP